MLIFSPLFLSKFQGFKGDIIEKNRNDGLFTSSWPNERKQRNYSVFLTKENACIVCNLCDSCCFETTHFISREKGLNPVTLFYFSGGISEKYNLSRVWNSRPFTPNSDR